MKQKIFRDEDLGEFFKNEKGDIFRDYCICCKSKENSIWVKFFDNQVKFLKCNNCNFIWGSPICNQANLNKYYDNYINKRRLNFKKKMELRDKQYKQDVSFITKSLKNGKLLDVGCNGGFFLEKFPNKFDKYGIDIDEKAINYGKKTFSFGKNLSCGSFLEKDYPDNFFDGVVLRGTIEHLIEPEKFISKASNLLKKGGKLFILATPNSNSISAKLFKEHWTLFHPIQHISHFDKNNISIILQRHDLRLIRYTYPYLGTPYENFFKDVIDFIICFLKKINNKNNKFFNSPPFFWKHDVSRIHKKMIKIFCEK